MSTARFWSKVDKSGECWVWTAARTNGYGVAHVSGKSRRAHRVAYGDAYGPIPEGLVIDHLCENKACVRPSHLEAVTQGENVRRAEKSRSPLSEDEAQRIKSQNAYLTTAHVAAILGVSVQTVSRWVAEEKLKPALKAPGIRGPLFFRAEDVDALAGAA